MIDFHLITGNPHLITRGTKPGTRVTLQDFLLRSIEILDSSPCAVSLKKLIFVSHCGTVPSFLGFPSGPPLAPGRSPCLTLSFVFFLLALQPKTLLPVMTGVK